MDFKDQLVNLDRSVYYYDRLGSTNDQARLLAEEGVPDGSLVVAESQDAGKGRRGRNFFSPEGSGIWMSLILRPDISPVQASMITLVAAVAVQEMMEAFQIPSGIKWPNDLVINGRKVTGILTEMRAEPDKVNYIILGVGINVNMKEFPKELRDIATSMRIQTGRNYNRAEVLRCFLYHFQKNYEKFLEIGDLSGLQETYNAKLIHMNKAISVHEIRQEWCGISRGINNIGELIVTSENGDEVVRSGEVSIRGVYGYME